MNGKPPRMNAVLTFDQLLEECQDRFSDPEEALREAVYLQPFRYDDFWYLQGLMIYKHISWQLYALRNIPPGKRRLLGLGCQEVFSPPYKIGDPEDASNMPKYWKVMRNFRYSSKGTFKPHTIISCISDTAVNNTHQGLTTNELIAIVNTMLIRVNHAPFLNCNFHPVHRRGELFKTFYDGKSLALQHSQLWTFENPLTACACRDVRSVQPKPTGWSRELYSLY
ncbi:hypothetical protein N7491_004515 [Penicillium cf. griseofulvum]|uniref:Uncharacterized protein n=1 Tax=Penicillium cf. griseofulvum TaxID=2972120 RepID=A0A9W9J5V3_9EURO|nr:hypothetical protein N7472_007205 [Penicillium cf. griseofulvum]KAJ5433920.1 hypothetical protein N7491_004515 [Penicillium cf. griseofulvum]